MGRPSLSFVLLLALVLPVLSSAAQPSHPGRDAYVQYCAPCHGTDLGGGNGADLSDDVWRYGSQRSQIFHNISAGLEDQGMPAFGAVLSDDEIHAIVDFITASAEGAAPVAEADASPAPETVDEPETLDEHETLDYVYAVELVADGLDVPWGLDFVDERTALVTERPGRLRVLEDGRLRPEPVRGTPEVLHEGQGGLLDVAVDPDYDENGWIYLAYSHALPGDGGDDRPPAMTRVVRGRLEGNRWTDQQVVFEAPHETYRTTRHHYGTRIVFDPDGYLYFSIGDRGAGEHAQDLGRPNGKVHRLHRDGSIPADNPFAGRAGALGSVFTYGHRNPQGLAVHPETGEVWAVEHGPRGGDELNRLVAGRNYGWPVISYGINYDGSIMTEERRRPGMEQPVVYWRPSIAVGGLAFYDGGLFPYWRGHALVSALRQEEVRLLDLHGDRVLHQEVILSDAGRVREAVPGPDGAVYVVLNDPHRVVRLTLRRAATAKPD